MQTRIAVIGPQDFSETQRTYSPRDLQSLHYYQDKINEAIMVLETNCHVLRSLRNFYEALTENSSFPWWDTSRADIAIFARQVDEMIYDSNMQIARAKLLVQITTDRRDLVSNTADLVVTYVTTSLCLSTYWEVCRFYSTYRVRRRIEWRCWREACTISVSSHRRSQSSCESSPQWP